MADQGFPLPLTMDGRADRVVPASGITAQLTAFVSGVMAFLAVFALALSLSTARLANNWGQELAGSATIRVLAPPGERGAQTEAVLQVLQTTDGVLDARALSDAEQSALLAPWLGADVALQSLPVPRLIEMQIDTQRFDPTGLRLRLQGEVPSAVLDDHGRWRAPLIASATRLYWLSFGILALIIASVAAMVTLAANAALSANSRVIRVLRLVGATDAFIAGAFIRRFALRAAIGAGLGTVAAVFLLVVLPEWDNDTSPGLLTDLGFRGAQWGLVVLVPVLSAGVAIVATSVATRKALRDQN